MRLITHYVKAFIITIFLICYSLLILKKGSPLIVIGSGIAILLLTSCISFQWALKSINYNDLGVFWGTMVLILWP